MKSISNTFLKYPFTQSIFNFMFTAAFMLFIWSCADLDQEPKSSIVSSNFYKTQSDAISAVTSVYSDLTHNTHGDHASIYNRLLVLAVGMSSDDHLPGPGATNPDVRSIAALTSSTTSGRYDELWRQHYEGIDRANAAIDRIPAIDFDPALRDRLVLEAKFLRAVYYFNLVRLWGDVPLVIHETTSLENINPTRTPAATVYQQIIDDLTDAEALPVEYPASDVGRATKGAAKALLLKVYATLERWDDALIKYAEIKSLGIYDLFPEYADLFEVAKKNTVEHIFSAQFLTDGNYLTNGTSNVNILSGASSPASLNGWDADVPHPSIVALFKQNDKRKAVTFFDSHNGTNFSPHFNKYIDLNSGIFQSQKNIPIIRYAEVILFYAEAINELQGPTEEAYDAINKVRNRAGLDDLTEGLTQFQFRDSVYQERRLEFVYEQIRWFDLLRTKRLVTELSQHVDKKNVSDKYYLLPIPQKEFDINPNLRPQNPGW